jgi:D-sedoheptulose 7-phosphate isomerase
MKQNLFFENYLSKFSTLISEDKNVHANLINLKKIISKLKAKNKIIVCGNGGSASISSHFSTDLNKIAKIRCVNFNEANLITCLANDYGYENWLAKAIDFYGDKNDVLIAISSSGESKNILNACKKAINKKFSKVVTFSGFSNKNSLKKLGNINFWVNSNNYNYIENLHQIWLLSVVDSLKK